MQRAKIVMKGMSSEQQDLLEQLLTKLRQEQLTRLQSEEQNEQVMSRMVLTQQQLEQQIRNLSAKGKPIRDINSVNMANGTTTAGGMSSSAMTPLDSDDEHSNMGRANGFADFVRDNSASTTPMNNAPYNQ